MNFLLFKYTLNHCATMQKCAKTFSKIWELFKNIYTYMYICICIKIERKRAYKNHKYLTQYSNNTYKQFCNKIDFELRLFFIRHMFCLDWQFIYDRRIHINCILHTMYSVCISNCFFNIFFDLEFVRFVSAQNKEISIGRSIDAGTAINLKTGS